MQKQSVTYLSTLLAVLFCGLMIFAGSALAETVLSVDDCAKCHELQPREIDEAGAAHKDAIDCLECHTGHRPSSPANIPACSVCHSGTTHYELESCMICHNPHQPMRIVLEGDLKAECLTCHTEQNEQLVANPSAHTDVACNFCHADTHGAIPACSVCHDAHSDQMVQDDCATCHEVHQPMVLNYSDSTQNILCAACHEDANDQLMASKTLHHDVTCVTCHTDTHKMVPQCSDCHDLPHAAGIHAKFPECGSCHNTAHDLNNF
ncbi:MAG: cytochrome C [Chloroflexi bacterium]|nr:cytochrome C [Chloroflexota bacterium]